MASGLEEWREKDFDEALKAKKTFVIDFWSPWCKACKTIEPFFKDLAMAYGKVSFAKIDVSKNTSVASKMGVMSLPNIIFFNGGKVVNQIIGATTKKAIEEKVKNLDLYKK